MARVDEERSLLGVARSEYYPQVAYGAGITGQQNNLLPNHTYYSYSFTTFWEIDLFGRIRNLNEAQRAVYFSSEEARRDIRLLVMAEVARGYFQLRALDEQIEIAQRTSKSFQDTLDIFQNKFAGGAASGLEVSRAQAALANVASNIPDFERQIVAQENCCWDVIQARSRGERHSRSKMTRRTFPPGFPPLFWSDGRTCAKPSRT